MNKNILYTISLTISIIAIVFTALFTYLQMHLIDAEIDTDVSYTIFFIQIIFLLLMSVSAVIIGIISKNKLKRMEKKAVRGFNLGILNITLCFGYLIFMWFFKFCVELRHL